MDVEKIINSVKDGVASSAKAVEEKVENISKHDDAKDSDDKIADLLDQISKKITSTVEQVASATEPTIKKTKAAIYHKFYEDYQKAGTPYGDTHEGFLKWTNEKENSFRSKVSAELEKGREEMLKAFHNTKDFVTRQVDQRKSASDSVVDEETKP